MSFNWCCFVLLIVLQLDRQEKEVVVTSRRSIYWLRTVRIPVLISLRYIAVNLFDMFHSTTQEQSVDHGTGGREDQAQRDHHDRLDSYFRNDDELEAICDLAPIQEFWFPLSEEAVWSNWAMDVWRELTPFNASRGETGTILPKFQSIQKRHSSKDWVLTDTHNGWEGTTHDFLMCKKGHALTVHAVGAVIELTGQNEAPFPTKQHKAKFIRDLLRIHVLRREKAGLHGVITDMFRVDVVRLSGTATAPTIVRTSTSDRASEYIGQLLKCTAKQLGITCSAYFFVGNFIYSSINLLI